MARRSTMLFAGLALAFGFVSVGPVMGEGPRAGAGTGGPSPAAEIVAQRLPAGGGGGGATLDVEAQATLSVTTAADDGSAGSLRDVIENQATDAGGDTVVLAAGATYVLTCAEGGSLEHGDTPLEIEGNGATVTMEAACEDGILVNGTGALVIRDVSFTGLDLTPSSALTAIVETGGPFALVGGRVADNTVDTGAESLDGFFFKNADALGDVVVEGTVFENNTRDVGNDCGIFCINGNLSLRNVVIGDTTVDAQNACGGIVCVSGDVELVDSIVATTTNTGPSHCGGIACVDGEFALTRTAIAATSSTMSGSGGVCGGILCTSGGVSMTDSSVIDTSASDLDHQACGPGFLCGNGDVELVRSTISGTRVVLSPGSGENDCGSMVCTSGGLSAVNSTVADNTTTGGGMLPAAFTVGGPTELVYATFVGNSGSGLPALGTFDVETAELRTFGSVLAGSGSGGTCAAGVVVTSLGYDFADDTSCGLTATGDVQQEGADPQLAAPADNGGPGPTMLPAMSSPLVDAIPPAACPTELAITTDERSLPRPSALGPSCDIGAVELQPRLVVVEPTFTG